jgi:hypothetical protein
MTRAILLACAPWLLVLIASLGVLYVLVRLSGARLELSRLRGLHADQQGSAQSLSFVLTLPLFIMVLLFIVQVSQLMIGQVVVEYAAFAGARAAAVWIPADMSLIDPRDGANCISSFSLDPAGTDQVAPSPNGPSDGGETFLVAPGSPKYTKIASAAVLACMPISPSRSLGAVLSAQDAATAAIIETAYAALAPNSTANPSTNSRIENKLAYAAANTVVEIRFCHSNLEPPLNQQWNGPYNIAPYPDEFQFNELGWQDQITVTVKHNLALLPGPGRLLARYVAGIGGQQGSATNVYSDLYTYPLVASATIGNEGEKPVIPYVYQGL